MINKKKFPSFVDKTSITVYTSYCRQNYKKAYLKFRQLYTVLLSQNDALDNMRKIEFGKTPLCQFTDNMRFMKLN